MTKIIQSLKLSPETMENEDCLLYVYDALEDNELKLWSLDNAVQKFSRMYLARKLGITESPEQSSKIRAALSAFRLALELNKMDEVVARQQLAKREIRTQAFEKILDRISRDENTIRMGFVHMPMEKALDTIKMVGTARKKTSLKLDLSKLSPIGETEENPF